MIFLPSMLYVYLDGSQQNQQLGKSGGKKSRPCLHIHTVLSPLTAWADFSPLGLQKAKFVGRWSYYANVQAELSRCFHYMP